MVKKDFYSALVPGMEVVTGLWIILLRAPSGCCSISEGMPKAFQDSCIISRRLSMEGKVPATPSSSLTCALCAGETHGQHVFTKTLPDINPCY